MRHFDWDSRVQGHILSAFFYGYITTQLIGGYLGAKLGGKKVYGIGVAATAALTIITPVLAKQSVTLLIAVRVVEGIFEVRNHHPSITIITTIWKQLRYCSIERWNRMILPCS